MAAASTGPLPFLPQKGEMASLILKHDWKQTSLGDFDQWPQSLKTTLSIVLHSRFPSVLFWGKDLICFYNDAFRPSLGNEGKHPWSLGKKGEVMWSEIWSTIKPWIDQVLSGGESIWMENQLVPFYRNGRIEEIYWTFCYSAVYDEGGKPAGVFVTCTETTEVILSEKKLKESELFARNIILHSEAAQAVLSGENLVFELANEKMLQMLGKDEEIIGTPLVEAMPSFNDPGLLKNLRAVLEKGDTFFQPEKMFTVEGNGIPQKGFYNCSYKALQNAEGQNYAVLCTYIDITDQVESRKKLEESESNFKRFVLQAPVGICIVTRDTISVETINDLFLELVGRKREEMENRPFWEVISEAADLYSPILRNVFMTGQVFTGTEHEIKLIRKNVSETLYVNFVYEPIRDENNNIAKVMMVAIDVTSQVLARRKIQEAQLREKLAIDVSQLGVFEVDLINNTVIASPRLEQIFEVEKTTDRARFVQSIHPEDLPARQLAYEAAYRSGILEYEGRIIRKDKSIRWMRSRGKIIFGADGVPQKLIGVTQDITEEKEFEEELNKQVQQRTLELQRKNVELERSNQKLEEFAHASSHDLKEPIRKIIFFIDRLKYQLGSSLNEQELLTLSRIETSTKRMVALIDDMLLYSHVSQVPFEKELVDLNKKVELVLDDLELDIQEKQAVIDVQPLPVIKGYRRQIQQLFQNLISNSIKYSKSGVPPKITIRAKEVEADEFNMLFKDARVSGKFHLIEVKDNGIGFEPQYSEQIFGIFQRLHDKKEYAGTGVGLAIARKVVDNHNGHIFAEAEPGKGAVFKIFLPVE